MREWLGHYLLELGEGRPFFGFPFQHLVQQFIEQRPVALACDVDQPFNSLLTHVFLIVVINFESAAHDADVEYGGAEGKYGGFCAVLGGRLLLGLSDGAELLGGEVDIVVLGQPVALLGH